MFIGQFVPLLVVLIVVTVVVYAVVVRRRQEGAHEPDLGIGVVRRLYFYIVSFVALMMAANGLVQIGQYVLDELFGGVVISPSKTRLAIGASLLIVSLPLWALHWRIVQGHVRELPAERRSVIRKFYSYLVLGIAVALSFPAAIDLVQWAFRVDRFDGYDWAALVVWAVVWGFHWSVEAAEGQPTGDTLGVRRLYLYLASLVALVVVAIGAGRILNVVFREAYDVLFSVPVLLRGEPGLWQRPLREGLSWVLVGGVGWGAHWLYFARRDYGSVFRQVYLYIFAVLGGVVTFLVSLGFILFGTLVWLMGVPSEEVTAEHFRFLPGSLAALVIGAVLGVYHWMTVRQEAQVSAVEAVGARRSYAYIMSALGLGALVVAVVTLVDMSLSALAESGRTVVTGPDIWRNQLAAVITLGILGAPIWGYYWWRVVQRQVEAGGVEERVAIARRVYIFAALGVGALALLGSVSFVLFVFLRDWLETDLGMETLRTTKTAIGIAAAVAVFLPYHWGVYREDRRAEGVQPVPERRIARKEVSVLVNEGGEALVRDLEAVLGYRVIVLRWADPGAAAPQLAAEGLQDLAQRINAASGSRVLVVPDTAGVRVLSYN